MKRKRKREKKTQPAYEDQSTVSKKNLAQRLRDGEECILTYHKLRMVIKKEKKPL